MSRAGFKSRNAPKNHERIPTTIVYERLRSAPSFCSARCCYDHPDAKRYSDRIETVTVDSVFQWMRRSGLGGAVQVIR